MLPFLGFLGFVVACSLVYIIVSSLRDAQEETIRNEFFIRTMISIGISLTAGVILIFSFLLINFQTENGRIYELNEIGDIVAGFSSFLAFLWLIIAVSIQSVEIRNQHRELRETTEAAKDQALSLQRSVRAQNHLHMEKRQEQYADYLRKLRKQTVTWIIARNKAYNTVPAADELSAAPLKGLDLWLSEISDISVEGVTIKIAPKSHISEDDYLSLIDICETTADIWKILYTIIRLADEAGLQAEYEAWEKYMDLDWVPATHDLCKALKHGVECRIAAGTGPRLSMKAAQAVRLLATFHATRYEAVGGSICRYPWRRSPDVMPA